MELFTEDCQAGERVALAISENSSLTLVWCPAGSFTMGSAEISRDKPIHQATQFEIKHSVTLTQGFWISQTPITQRAWQDAIDGNTDFEPDEQIAQLPIEEVRWDQAVGWCERVTHLLRNRGSILNQHLITLPTEAQWEYACRAGTTNRWYFGDDEALLGDYAWYRANSNLQIQPVGMKKPNPWGLYDLYGNVLEWCLDDFYTYKTHEERDPLHMEAGGPLKIVRGGEL